MSARARAFLGLASLFAFGACRRTEPHPISADPPSEIVDAPVDTPAPAPPSKGPRYAVISNHLVDLATAKDVASIPAGHLVSSSERDRVYVATIGSSATLMALDPSASFGTIWSIPRTCEAIQATASGVFCAGTDLVFLDRATGAVRTLAAPPTGTRVTDVVAVHDRVLAYSSDGEVASYDPASFARMGSIKLGWAVPAKLAVDDAGACVARLDSMEAELLCVDRDASHLRTTRYSLMGGPGALGGGPGLFYSVRQLDENFLVVASWPRGAYAHSLVVRRSDGALLLEVDEAISQAIARDDGSLDAVLVTNPRTRLLDPTGKLRWASPERLEARIDVVPYEDGYVVASWEGGTDGANLLSFDRTTGATRWKLDLGLTPLAHSAYLNEVTLAESFGRIVMRGVESGQEYIALVDPRSGVKALEVVKAGWK